MKPTPNPVESPATRTSTDGDFPPPRPLVIELRPVPTFDADALLPEPLKTWIADIADRMQSPIEFIAVSGIVGLASVIGRKVCIRPKRVDNWTVVPNLWAKIIGRPGMLKTPGMQESLQPLKKLEAASILAHILAPERAKRMRLIVGAKLDAAKSALQNAAKKKLSDIEMNLLADEISAAEEILKPKERRLIVNDATVEKLQELLAENPNGFLYYRDEINSLFQSFNRKGYESARGFFLQTWDGMQDYTTDRIIRGTVAGQRLCMSILGSIQPGPLAALIRSAAPDNGNDDGLICRFQLAVYPDAISKFTIVDRLPNDGIASEVDMIFERLDRMTGESIGATKDPRYDIHYLQFTDDAQEYFYDWLTLLETTKLRANESRMLESHFAKYRSLMPSLALIFHLVKLMHDGDTGPVSIEAAKRAAAWCDLLEQHARRIYTSASESDIEPATTLRDKLGKLPNPFTFRHILRKGWGGLDDAKTIALALAVLEDHNWIQAVEREPTVSGGRPTTDYFKNPRIIMTR